MADYLDVAMEFLTGTFRLPSETFAWPNVLFQLIIPMIATIIIWYSFLHKGVRFFHHSGINFGLAIIFSFFMIPFMHMLPASFLMIAAVTMYFLLGGNLNGKKMLLIIGLGLLIFFGYPILVSLIESNLNY